MTNCAMSDISGMPQRRFPPSWSVEETDPYFIVRDRNGQALAYVVFEEEAGRRAAAQAAHSPDGGELRQAAGVAAQDLSGR